MQMPTSQRESGVREMWADYALMHAFLLGNNSFVLKYIEIYSCHFKNPTVPFLRHLKELGLVCSKLGECMY